MLHFTNPESLKSYTHNFFVAWNPWNLSLNNHTTFSWCIFLRCLSGPSTRWRLNNPLVHESQDDKFSRKWILPFLLLKGQIDALDSGWNCWITQSTKIRIPKWGTSLKFDIALEKCPKRTVVFQPSFCSSYVVGSSHFQIPTRWILHDLESNGC